MTIRALLFDIDGTLVDSNDAHVEAWDRVFREAGHAFSREQLHDQVGKGGDNYVPALLPDLPEDEQERLAARHGPIYKAEHLPHVRPFAGARDVIVRAKQDGLKVALASSAKGEELDHYLDLLDARNLIDGTTSKDDVEASKPDPDIFQAALDKLGVRPDEALVIGDTPYDIDAARRCGIGTVAVLSGGFPKESLTDAVAIYRDVAELLAQWDTSPIRRDTKN